jgi:hypothetical protein
VVTNIAHIPLALAAVMRENATRPDFAPEGTTELKPWFGANLGIALPPEIDIPVVEAVAPYNEQIAKLSKQIGAVLPRQNMKDASGASQMDAKTQVTSLYGVSMLERAQYPLEANVCLALLHEPGGENDRKLLNVAIGAELNLHGDPALAAAQARARRRQRPQQRPCGCGEHPRACSRAPCARGDARDDRPLHRGWTEEFAGRDLRCPIDNTDAAMAKLFATSQRDAKADAILEGLEARVPRRFSSLSADARRTSDRGWGARRDCDDARVGTADAQADLAADRREPAMVDPPVRRVDRCISAAERHEPDRFCGITGPKSLGSARSPRWRTLPSSGSRPSRRTSSLSRPWSDFC